MGGRQYLLLPEETCKGRLPSLTCRTNVSKNSVRTRRRIYKYTSSYFLCVGAEPMIKDQDHLIRLQSI